MPRLRTRTKEAVRTAINRVGFDLRRRIEPRYLDQNPTGTHHEAPPLDRLDELRQAYASDGSPASAHTFWNRNRIKSRIPLDRFRADTLFVWQYVHEPARAEYKYFIYLRYLESIDHASLLEKLEEDGAFGAPFFTFPDRRPISRDLLDSVNEILYLDRRLDILSRPELRVLDIGAGYGRLAHRMSQAAPGLVDYLCVDAIPESTFLCERYLDYRDDTPPCRVVALPDADDAIRSSTWDLAVNIHSFPEMSRDAAAHWIQLVGEAAVPALLVVPNAPTEIMSTEDDGRRLDLMPVLREAGYELDDREPIIRDDAARELFEIHDHFHLFRRS